MTIARYSRAKQTFLYLDHEEWYVNKINLSTMLLFHVVFHKIRKNFHDRKKADLESSLYLQWIREGKHTKYLRTEKHYPGTSRPRLSVAGTLTYIILPDCLLSTERKEQPMNARN